MENLAQILIYIHASFGGLALLFGAIALFSKKGSRVHKKSGILFFYTMLVSAFMALVIANIPNHESLFLILIGIFSTYFLVGGYRCLNYKKKDSNLVIDKVIAWSMLVTAIGMIIIPIILNKEINIVLAVFGIVGLIFSIRDVSLYKKRDKLKKVWLKLHVGKMMGGYISAVTAFMVVNEFLPGAYGWFLPGLIGGIYISYWMRKINKTLQVN